MSYVALPKIEAAVFSPTNSIPSSIIHLRTFSAGKRDDASRDRYPYFSPVLDVGVSRDRADRTASIPVAVRGGGRVSGRAQTAWLKRLPDNKPHYKSIFSVIICLFYLVGLFDLWTGVGTLLIDAIGTYVIIYVVDGSLMPWLVFMQVKLRDRNYRPRTGR
ncbi:hypothetical protein CLCR_10836 [Cladophialophora carrionii]|uniref:Uncharacterized protein n=1 Tax=Cladophialophora carrionii TaxID=86049 RepID=A0A1C1CZK2_9EURO|nr:hypothetical protein CLCR_10836 [Cladophialophora carrionii]